MKSLTLLQSLNDSESELSLEMNIKMDEILSKKDAEEFDKYLQKNKTKLSLVELKKVYSRFLKIAKKYK